jgi:hypothetical protein
MTSKVCKIHAPNQRPSGGLAAVAVVAMALSACGSEEPQEESATASATVDGGAVEAVALAAKTCGSEGKRCCPQGTPCAGLLVCQGGTCRTCGSEGKPCCTQGNPCSGLLSCQSGTCRVTKPRNNGEPCSSSGECKSGICDQASLICCNRHCSSSSQCVGGTTCKLDDGVRCRKVGGNECAHECVGSCANTGLLCATDADCEPPGGPCLTICQ